MPFQQRQDKRTRQVQSAKHVPCVLNTGNLIPTTIMALLLSFLVPDHILLPVKFSILKLSIYPFCLVCKHWSQCLRSFVLTYFPRKKITLNPNLISTLPTYVQKSIQNLGVYRVEDDTDLVPEDVDLLPNLGRLSSKVRMSKDWTCLTKLKSLDIPIGLEVDNCFPLHHLPLELEELNIKTMESNFCRHVLVNLTKYSALRDLNMARMCAYDDLFHFPLHLTCLKMEYCHLSIHSLKTNELKELTCSAAQLRWTTLSFPVLEKLTILDPSAEQPALDGTFLERMPALQELKLCNNVRPRRNIFKIPSGKEAILSLERCSEMIIQVYSNNGGIIEYHIDNDRLRPCICNYTEIRKQ